MMNFKTFNNYGFLVQRRLITFPITRYKSKDSLNVSLLLLEIVRSRYFKRRLLDISEETKWSWYTNELDTN